MRGTDIVLVCGLGNPGPEYEHTRHNAGFAVVNELAGRMGARYWKDEAGCLVARVPMRGDVGSHELLLAKPQGFMNTSGGPLSKLMRSEHVALDGLLVIHDEVDLAAGEVRVKEGGGLNAHNGLRSIAAKLGSRDFARVQLGIGRPPGRMSVADWALRQLKGAYAEEFALSVQRAADIVEARLAEALG